MDLVPVLRMLEKADEIELRPALAFLAGRELSFEPAELKGALRRALLLLAAGGDPRTALDLDGRAVTAFAGELDDPEKRAGLSHGLKALEPPDGLPKVSAALSRLRADPDLAWRAYACALIADELGYTA